MSFWSVGWVHVGTPFHIPEADVMFGNISILVVNINFREYDVCQTLVAENSMPSVDPLDCWFYRPVKKFGPVMHLKLVW